MSEKKSKNGTIRKNLHQGLLVDIVLKENQRTGKLTRGTIKDILTNQPNHPHGIKVRLQDGRVGRVKHVISTDDPEIAKLVDGKNSKDQEEEQPKTDGSTARFSEEKREIKKLFTPFKNLKRPVKYKIPRERHDDLVKELEGRLKVHFDKFGNELSACFLNFSNPIIAFDVEEIYNEVLCVLAVRLEKDMSFKVYLDSVARKPNPELTKKAMDKLVRWIAGFNDQPMVLLHGFNKNERSMYEALEKYGAVVNTQEELGKLISEGNDRGIEKENLHDFQDVMGLKPQACTFIKHARDHPELPKKDLARIWSPQAKIAITRLATGKNVRNCKVCGRPQDPFLYCLEDAFTTLLVHAVHEACT